MLISTGLYNHAELITTSYAVMLTTRTSDQIETATLICVLSLCAYGDRAAYVTRKYTHTLHCDEQSTPYFMRPYFLRAMVIIHDKGADVIKCPLNGVGYKQCIVCRNGLRYCSPSVQRTEARLMF